MLYLNFHSLSDVQYNSTGVSVTTTTGDTYGADFAVITFSIGVLQHDVVKFVPEMPRYHCTSLYKCTLLHRDISHDIKIM